MAMDRIVNTVKEQGLLTKGDTVIVGLSGGPDSLCLFHVLYKLRESLGIDIAALHVNHKFRPGAAEEDQTFVENLCNDMMVPCKIVVADCNAIALAEGVTSEEAGRMVRYMAFDDYAEDICKANGNTRSQIKIAVAQNANDQAETVMFRLLRGTGTDGLAGIEYKRQSEAGFTIIRPLLDTWRVDIERYCQDNCLNPCIDKTNHQAIYTRNKIRLDILPYLEEKSNPKLMEALIRLSKSASEDKAFLWKLAKAEFDAAYCNETPISRNSITASQCFANTDNSTDNFTDNSAGNSADNSITSISRDITDENDFATSIILDLKKISALDPAIMHRVISLAFSKIGLTQDIERVHLEAANRLIAAGRTGTSTDFPKGYKMKISYEKIIFTKESAELNRLQNKSKQSSSIQTGQVLTTKAAQEQCRILRIDDETDEYWVLVSGICQKTVTVKLNKDLLKKSHNLDIENFVIRTRLQGDYIYVSETARKKIKDYYIDSKIPRELRNIVPLVCIGSEVLAVLGSEITGINETPYKTRITSRYYNHV